MPIHLRRKVGPWGSGFGVRLTRTDLKRLGIQPGEEVELDVTPTSRMRSIDDLPSWNLGGGTGDLDEDTAAEVEEKLAHQRPAGIAKRPGSLRREPHANR